MADSVARRRNLLVHYLLAACLASTWFCATFEAGQSGHYSYADGGELRPPFPVPYQLYARTFRVGRRVVTDFPQEVMLEVDLVSGVPCSKGIPPGPAIPSLEGLKSLRAEAVYLRDLKKYPLEIGLAEVTDLDWRK